MFYSLQYYPLTLWTEKPRDSGCTDYQLKNHTGEPNKKDQNHGFDEELPHDSLITRGTKRGTKPKLLICVTLYNEPYSQICESLAGLFRCYYELVNYDDSYLNRVQVVIVADGYDRLDKDTLVRLEKAGIYDAFRSNKYKEARLTEDRKDYKIVFKELQFINKDVMNADMRMYGTYNVGHWFSRTMHFLEFLNGLDNAERKNFRINNYDINDFLLGSSKTGQAVKKEFYHLPMPIHLLIKHRNLGKIDSHKWFFKGFCKYMDPDFSQILDWGSIPLWNSISYLIKHMEKFKNIGGCSGEIEVIIPEKNPETNESYTFFQEMLLRSQYVEYKVSHYLDKAMESSFGFVSVLPGAFSTFRWECIRGEPLTQFLKGAKDEFAEQIIIPSCSVANKNLAEDRIMCLEIVIQKNTNWIISYIPSAKCLTDPPISLTGLLKQRRRWFNGSLFATFSVTAGLWKVLRRSGNWCRKLGYLVLYLYILIITGLSFVLVGLFYATFSIFVRATLPASDNPNIFRVANVLENAYLLFLFLVTMLSTAVRIEWAEFGFRLASLFMGMLTVIMVAWSIAYAYNESTKGVEGGMPLIAFWILFHSPYYV